MKIRFAWLAAGLLTGAMFVLSACGPKYPNCENDEHCKDHNQFCVDKLCRDCKSSDQCKAKGPCGFCGPSYTCDKPAGTPGDCCVSDLDCKQGKCWKLPGAERGSCAQCAVDQDCGALMKCVQGSCVPAAECDATHPCPPGKVCENGSCVGIQCNLDPIYFDFDESAIRSDARDTLNRDFECIKKKGQSVAVEGNCDERGSDEYNLALGTRRADSTRRFLENLGASGLSSTSFGEERPTCTDHSEDCWAKNRRADVRFK
jgi:peptidoglycan-associated lipoprotein